MPNLIIEVNFLQNIISILDQSIKEDGDNILTILHVILHLI